jgi:hypothetical protein
MKNGGRLIVFPRFSLSLTPQRNISPEASMHCTCIQRLSSDGNEAMTPPISSGKPTRPRRDHGIEALVVTHSTTTGIVSTTSFMAA